MSDPRREDPFASHTGPRPRNVVTIPAMSSDSSLSASMGGSILPSRSLMMSSMVAEAAKSKLNLESSNIAQLRISNMNLHGREDEIKLLRGKLREMAKKGKEDNNRAAEDDVGAPSSANKNAKKSFNNMILVEGDAGTGKSALISKGLGGPASKLGYILATGKFDDRMRCPLSGFSDAMTNLVKHIEKNRTGKLKMSAALIRDKLQDEFNREELEQIRSVLPECVGLFESSIDERRRTKVNLPTLSEAVLERDISFSSLGSALRRRPSAVVTGKEAISRTQFTIRRLLKVICSHLKGLVLFIDNLQWSDKATLELLRSIVLDGEIPSLLIVGAYREDEVPDNLQFASYIQDLEQMNVTITQIKIDNLNADGVCPLVAEALGMDEEDDNVKTLANITHKKTEGNPFFVLMFLISLYDEKLIQYNFGAMKWTWDDDAVNSKIVTDNVASVLVDKMNRLQEDTQKMLMVASCLGASFKVSAIVEVMKNISDGEIRSSMRSSSSSILTGSFLLKEGESFASRDGSVSSFASSIKEFEEEGLVEMEGNETGRFVHNQVQSAAFELISPEQRNSFRAKIGSTLLNTLSPDELETNLFEVVGLLNCAASETDTDVERDRLAKLNLRAGTKASDNGAFDTASVYFQAGRDALGSSGWEDDYSTMLDLCSDGANACFLTGDLDTMNELIDEVLSKDIDTVEKYRVSEIKVKSLHAVGKVNESIDAALDFRRQLGLPTPQKKPASKFTIAREYMRVKRLLKKKTAEDIANLPELDDERQEMGQRMNELLIVCVFQVQPTMLPLIIFLLTTTTLKHGLNPSSCDAFAGLGMILCGRLGKLEKGCEMAKAAELIVKQPGMRRITSKTIFVAQSFCYHWTEPLQDTVTPLLEGCQKGLEIGDTDSACSCLVVRSYCLYFTGRPLESIQEELEATIEVMTQLRQDARKMRIVILLATVKKLRGIDTEAGDEKMDSLLATAAATGNFSLAAFVNSMKLEVFVIFQQWEEAIELVQKSGNVRLALTSAFNTVRYTFLQTLTYFKAAQTASGKKRKQMKKCGKTTLKVIQGWAKNGNVNVVHYLRILEAELDLLEGNVKKAEESFKAAISS